MFFGVFGAVYSSLAPFAYFVACFFAVAGRAERLQVIEVVRTTSCDIEYVVYFQVLGAAAFDAPITVTVENLFTEFVGCTS